MFQVAQLVLEGDNLQLVDTVSHLGLTLAPTLKLSDHMLAFSLFDQRKAFDRVWHDGLLSKLHGSSGDMRLSICLDHVAKSPPLKVAHLRPQRLEQVYPRVPFLVLYFFQST